MRRLVIAVDCDDVLVRTTPFFVEAYNRAYGTSVALYEAHEPQFEKWGAEENEVTRRFALLMETEEYKMLGPDASEAAILHKMATTHELHLITARKEHERNFTQAMLERELRGVFRSMEFVGWSGSKGEICRKINADVLIDDNANYLLDAIENGLPVEGALLFGDYPWQLKDASQGLVRCKTWHDVEVEIGRIASR